MKDKIFVSAIIVAAGNSTRMGFGYSKQLIELNGKTVLERTISNFSESKLTDEIILVCRNEDVEIFKNIINSRIILNKSIKFVPGGNCRQKSVENGVKLSSEVSTHFVIHDCARPLITPDDIDNAIKKGIELNSVVLGIPVIDTIKIIEDGRVKYTPDRSTLRAIQTPQIFKKSIYIEALRVAESSNIEFTDDSLLLEHFGYSVYIIDGNVDNIKITSPKDIAVAEEILRRRVAENV